MDKKYRTVILQKIMSSMKFSYKDENVYRFMKVYNGEGLISGSGPKWRQDRKYIFPLLNGKQIGPYFERMIYHSNYLITKLKPEINQKTFNIEHYLHRAAADMVNGNKIFYLLTNSLNPFVRDNNWN